jgi:hypothetical protein
MGSQNFTPLHAVAKGFTALLNPFLKRIIGSESDV